MSGRSLTRLRARASSQSGFMARSSEGYGDLVEDVLQDLAGALAVLAGVTGDDPVREHGDRELLHVVGDDVLPRFEERARLGRSPEGERAAGRDADRELGGRARPGRDLDYVVDDRLVDAD